MYVCPEGRWGRIGSGGARAHTLLALSDFMVLFLYFPEDSEGMGMCQGEDMALLRKPVWEPQV